MVGTQEETLLNRYGSGSSLPVLKYCTSSSPGRPEAEPGEAAGEGEGQGAHTRGATGRSEQRGVRLHQVLRPQPQQEP
jgi:hypothetical protein